MPIRAASGASEKLAGLKTIRAEHGNRPQLHAPERVVAFDKMVLESGASMERHGAGQGEAAGRMDLPGEIGDPLNLRRAGYHK